MSLNDSHLTTPLPEQAPACSGTLQPTYPLLVTMLNGLGLTMQPTYSCKDVAALFGVSARTIQSKVADGTIPSRDLIGGARFLPVDLEEYLRNARKPPTR